MSTTIAGPLEQTGPWDDSHFRREVTGSEEYPPRMSFATDAWRHFEECVATETPVRDTLERPAPGDAQRQMARSSETLIVS